MREPAWLAGRCLLCADPSGRDALCGGCLRGLPPVGAACPTCALPVTDTRQPCPACRLAPPPWDRALASLRYDFPVDVLVQALKFRRDLAAGAALAAAMIRAGPPPGVDGARPWLVPIPLHRRREAWRGFNQATELALHLSRATGWSLRARHLRRTRPTRPQSGLTLARRRRNLDGAFLWRGPDLRGVAVVLVDDVLTTGATAAACARALAGAESVTLWVAARALAEALSPPAGPSARGHASGR